MKANGLLNMKKYRLLIILLLGLALAILPLLPVYALESSHMQWPDFSGNGNRDYISRLGYVHFSEHSTGYVFSVPSYLVVELTLPESLYNSDLQVELFTKANNTNGVISDSGEKYGEGVLESNRRIESVSDKSENYSKMQFWRFYENNSTRSIILPVITINGDSANSAEAAMVDKIDAYTDRAQKLVTIMKEFNRLFDELCNVQNSSGVCVGNYYPSDINLVCKIANAVQTEFDITIGYFDTHSLWVEGDGWNNATIEDVINHWTTYKNPRTEEPLIASGEKISQKQIDKLDILLDIVAPYWINYIENHRIVLPAITHYEVAGSRGVIDSDTRTIRVRIPSGIDNNSLLNPIIKTSGDSLCSVFAGSLSAGEALYQVTPGDNATGTYFNGKDTTGYGFGVDLSTTWKVIVEEGDPYNKAISFSVITGDGKERFAQIADGEEGSKGSIVLNLPYGTDLSQIDPLLDIAGEGYYYVVDGIRTETDAAIDFSRDIELVVYNTAYGLETIYTVELTANRSSEKDILSYKIGDAEGTINGDTISITIPYATDLATAEAEVEVSEFAVLSGKPQTLVEGNNEYTVTAEDGSTKSYNVIISRAAVSKEKKILSFKCGGYTAVINDAASTVTLDLPKGMSSVFAPEIEVSEFATITPASGEVQDFSSPVKYKVKAQNGSSKTYTVTVNIQQEDAPNEYKASLETIVDRIISRYRTQASDDWEWMDLGLYEGLPENYNTGQDHDFDIAKELSTLDSTTAVGMTELARTIMMLTARGFDCSRLSCYNGGTPFKDSKGNDVDDLVSVLYNFSDGYTINGPAFALIALDMGSYTIPEDALWTREKLLDELVVYSGSEFGIDMVGAIMYAIAPYQDDPVYGTMIKTKLNSCLESVLRQMNSDYSFGAWGNTNSESAAWVMMGLCSMGIDWNIDPRFADGQDHSALQHWMDNFANVQEGYFHHTTSVRNNYMATYEGCYASMWYLGFLENGGQGNPYYFYYHRFDFGEPLSEDASILAFEIEGKQGVITEAEENSIVVTLANGTPLTDLKPVITLAEGAKLIAPSLPVTFVEGVKQPFTVCAEDGKTYKTYYVTIVYDDVQASGAELDTDTIELKNSVLNEEAILDKTVIKASDGATEILITVKPGVDTDKMYLNAEVSYAASCNPVLDGNTAFDLSDWLTVTVTSEDGLTTNLYRIKVVAKSMAEITSFRVEADGIWYSGEIDNAANTIVVRDVDDSNLTSTELLTDIDFTGRTCQPTSGLAIDFAGAVTYTLGGDTELAGRNYTVKVLNKSGKFITAKASGGNTDPSGEPGGNSGSNTGYGNAMILSFVLFGREGVIDQNAGTITVTLPQGTNLSAVVPQITVSDGATVSPVSGQVVDLVQPITYIVKSTNETKKYVVSVIFERSISQQLWDAVMKENDIVDHQVSHRYRFH